MFEIALIACGDSSLESYFARLGALRRIPRLQQQKLEVPTKDRLGGTRKIRVARQVKCIIG